MMSKSLVFLFLMIIGILAENKDLNTACISTTEAPVLNGSYGDLGLTQSISELAGSTCEWVIDGTNNKPLNIHLDFIENLVLGDNDSLRIFTDDNKTVIYETKGFQWPGVILLGDKEKRIRVKLTLTNDKIYRNFDVNYGTNVSAVQIQDIESTGKFVFPYKTDVDLPQINFTIVLKTKINSQNLLLNLETLDLSGGTVDFDKVAKYDNVTFSNSTTVPDFLLSTAQQITIKVSNLKKLAKDSKGLQLHYDLVDSVCSRYLIITDLDKQDKRTVNVLLPNTTALQSLSSYRCLNIFEHSNSLAKLLLDLRTFEFKNKADLITVLDGNTRDSKTLAVIESQFLDIYWRDLYIYSSTNKMWIMFESPQVVNRVADTSGIGVQALSQGGSYWFNANSTDIVLEISSKTSPPVPIVFTYTADSDKQVLIDFDDKPLPGAQGKLLIEIYESDGKSSQSFIKLNSGQIAPDIVASNTNQLKIAFNQSVDLKPTIKAVPKGCHSVYSGASGGSFSLSGSCSPLCSWLIPNKDTNSTGTFVFQFSHLNLPKSSDEIQIWELSPTVLNPILNFKGPLNTSTFPDIILNSDETYVMYIKRQCANGSQDNSQLIGVSLVFVDQILNTHEETVDKDKEIDLKTSNYPNYYSVGSDHTWKIGAVGGENKSVQALLTFSDVELSPGHQLLVRSKDLKNIISVTNITNLADSLVTLPLLLNLTSNSIDQKNQPFSGRGFMANLLTVGCGGNFSVSANEPLVINPTILDGNTKCIWTVSTDNPNSTAINLLEFKVNEGNDKDFAWQNLRIWDSNSMRESKMLNHSYFNTSRKSSSTNYLVIEYTIDPKKPMNLTFKQTVCSEKCINTKRCLLPEFYCNGINDCGDYSDERCNGSKPIPPPPTPPPAEIVYHSGVNGWVVFLVICPLCIGLGVLGTLFGPRMLSRVGRGRYREFQDFSEVS